MIRLTGAIAALPEFIEALSRAPDELQERLEVPQGYEYTPEDRRAIAGYTLEPDGTAVIPVVGMISSDRWGTSWPNIIRALQVSRTDPEVRQALLWLDTPGGAVGGITQAVQEVKGYGKPIKAHAAGICASAGYWLAAATGPGNLSAAPEAAIGGVGAVIFAIKEDSQYMVRFVSSRTPRKGASPSTEAGKEDRQRLVDSLGDLFLQQVGQARGLRGDLDSLAEQLGSGALLPVDDAKALGMVDRVETRMGPARRSIFFGVAAAAHIPQPGDSSRGAHAMEDKNPPADQLAAALALVATLTAERDDLDRKLRTQGQQHEQLTARLDDERQQRQQLATQVTDLKQRLDADREARVKAEGEAVKMEAHRAIDLMVMDGFPEHRREAAVQAYIQSKAGKTAWWDDIKASHVPGGPSHLRGGETHAGRPDPTKPKTARDAEDERVVAYMKDHPGSSPAEALKALDL